MPRWDDPFIDQEWNFGDILPRLPKFDVIGLGRYQDRLTGTVFGRLDYPGNKGVVIYGPMGTGKDARIITPMLLQNNGASFVVIDLKGESAATTGLFRACLGDVAIINPRGMLVDTPGYYHPKTGEWIDYKDLRSTHYNPLRGLSPNDKMLAVHCGHIANNLIEQATGGNSAYFTGGARNLVKIALMKEVIDAHEERRTPSMTRVRAMICMASALVPSTGEAIGWPKLARELQKSPNATLRNLSGQFLRWDEDIRSIQATAMGQTEFLDDPDFSNDMEGHGFDMGQIKRKPTTVYLMIQPDDLEPQEKYLKLVIGQALRAVMRPRQPGEPRVIFVLNEAYALGKIKYLEKVWSLLRGYGVLVISSWQSKAQMEQVWGKETTNTMIAGAGVQVAFRPDDPLTAEYLSARSGDTTVVVEGYNEGQQQNQNTAGSNTGDSLTQQKVRALKPHDLFGLGDGQMVQFVSGQKNYIPAYAPPYWRIRECRERARNNPFHQNG